MYMYKHVIKHTRSIKYICYLGLCNINTQFSPKYISINNNKNIWNFKAQNISETQFIENEIVQNEIMRLVLHAGRDLGSACWEIVMGTSIGWSGSCSFQLKTCLVTPWHSVVSPQRAPEHCSLWKVRQQVLERSLKKYITMQNKVISLNQ